MLGIIGWIIIGALAGMLAKFIMKEEGGLLKNIILGVLGGFVGGFVIQLFGGEGMTGFNVWSLVVATVGAIVLIGLGRLITKKA